MGDRLIRPRPQTTREATLRRPWLVFLALALLGFAIYYVFVGAIRPVDLDVFLRAGKAVARGHDPYSGIHSHAIYSNNAFVYPLAVAWWFAPLSALGGAAHVSYAIASLAAIILACWLMRPNEPLIAALVLLSSSTVVGLQDGTLNAWLLLGLVVAWRWRELPVTTGAAVAVLIVGKLFLWPLFGWLLISRRYRAAGITVLLTGTTLVAGWIFGPLSFHSYTSMLHILSQIEVPHTSSLSGLLLHWHASLDLATAVATGTGLVLLGIAGYRVRRRPADAGSDARVYGTAVAAALLASPIVWHHYYLLLAVPLLVASRSVWPFVLLSLVSWVAAAPHTTSLDRTIEGYVLGMGGIGGIAALALTTLVLDRRTRLPELPGLVRRRAGQAIRPVALAAALTILLVVAISALQRVLVDVAWGAAVTLVEVVAVLTFVWSRTAQVVSPDTRGASTRDLVSLG